MHNDYYHTKRVIEHIKKKKKNECQQINEELRPSLWISSYHQKLKQNK